MELRDYVAVLAKRKWLIISVTVVAVVIAVGISMLTARSYQGEAKILINDRNTGAALIGSQLSADSSQPDRDMQTQVELIQQRPLLQKVIAAEGLHTTPDDLLKQIKVSADTQANIITIDVVDKSPTRAADSANALAKAYVDWSRDTQRQSINAAADQVQKRLADVQAQMAAIGIVSAQTDPTGTKQQQLATARSLYQQLSASLAQLRLTANLVTGPASVVTSATPDPTPVSPNPLRNAALGAGLGLVLGVGLAFLSEKVTTRVSTAEEASQAYGSPILAEIPVEKFSAEETRRLTVMTHSESAASEGYRGLRNNLNFLNFEHKYGTLLVSSAVPGEGKSTVAANLAVVLANAGWRVALVVCDFRQPTTREFFQLEDEHGLSDVLLGTKELDEVLQAPQGIERLQVVVAGDAPPNPSEWLGSSRMEKMMTTLKQSVDYVILDTPPILAVSDSTSVARWADGALIVSRIGVTRKDEAEKAHAQLERAGAHVLGVVVLGVKEPGGSGYGYYSSYVHTDDASA